MKRKLLMTILTLTLALCSVLGLTACGGDEPPAPKYYTVIWQNHDGNILETDENVEEGTMPNYDGETPIKVGDAQYTYVFSGWSPEISAVAGDVVYVAQFNNVKNKYIVTWKDYDGTVLELDENVEYGTTPSFDRETPTREKDAQYTYAFSGWNPTVDSVTGSVVYTAEYSTTLNKYTVTWKNYDGTVLETDTEVTYGTIPVYNGNTPTKEKDTQYTYNFDGWDKTISAVVGDIIYTATYTSIVNRYTVTWKNYDDTILELDEGVEYGTMPSYNGATPTRERAEYTYTFIGWNKAVTEVMGNVVYTAQYSQELSKFTVVWKNYDGTVLKTDTDLLYQVTPEYVGQTPTKVKNAQYTYTFNGWSPTIAKITDDVVYTAQYSTTINKYTVTWKNYDGTVLETDTEVSYGTIPTYNGNTPTKEKDAQYTYTFSGWDKTISAVEGDITYTAKYSNTVNKYTITWKNHDGTVLKTDSVVYGTNPTYNGTTPYINNEGLSYEYVFNRWSPTIVTVQGDATYIAQFSTRELTKFTISYNANGGEGAPSAQTKNKNTSLVLATTKPTRKGYAFIGWNNAYENKVYQAGDIFEQNFVCTLYAMWEQLCDECDGNGYYTTGGRCFDCQGNGYFYNCRNCGSAYVQTNILQWYCYSCNATVTVNSRACTSCDGSGFIVKTHSCEKYIKQSAPTIKNIGEDFVELNIVDGYEYSKDGIIWQASNLFTGLKSSTTYTFYQRKATCNGIPFGVISDSVTATTNKATVYSIFFELQGGKEDTPNVKTYTFETESIILNNPVKEGYTFIGWSGSNGNSLQMEVVIPTGTRGNLNYTANWRINQYTITIVYGNGQENKVITQDYGSEVKETLPELEGLRPGYALMWDNVMPSTMPAKNLTISTKWEAIFTLNGNTITGLTPYGKILNLIQIPAKIDGVSVMSIGDSAFSGCSKLTSIEIPDSVTSIGSSVFLECTSLEAIEVDSNNQNYKTIDGNLYSKDGKTLIQYAPGKTATNFTIPNNVTNIGHYAFYSCSSLTSLRFPNSVTTIGYAALGGCSRLKDLTIPFVGYSIDATEAGSNTLFGYIFGRSNYSGSQATKQCYFSSVSSAYDSNYATYYIPASLKSVTITGGNIFFGAFYACESLTNIILPDEIKAIGEYAFYGCSQLNYNLKGELKYLGSEQNPYLYLVGVTNNNIVTATIDDECTFISSDAFSHCTSMISVTIPKGILSIGKHAFNYCIALQEIVYNASNCTDLDRDNNVFSGAGTSGPGITVTIGMDVKSFPAYLFNPYSDNEPKIISIVFEDGSKCERIGNTAFLDCTYLSSIYITDLSVWCSISFHDQPLIYAKNVKLYLNNELITDLIIPETVANLKNSVFKGYDLLTNAVIGENVTSIGDYAFYDCGSLTNVTIGNRVTSIGSSAFHSCESLTSLVIGNSVKSIGFCAFLGCDALTSVYYNGSESDWDNIAIDSFNSKLTSATRYYYIESQVDVPTDGGNYWHYDENGEIAIW